MRLLEILEIYNETLAEFPISLTGYSDIEDRINRYFKKLTEKSYFSNSKFILFSSSLAQIKNTENWKTDKLHHGFHFHSFKNIGEEQKLLSFYSFLKEKLNLGSNTINSLVELFSSDINFRVCCWNRNEIEIQYDCENKLISFKIPKKDLLRKVNSRVLFDTLSDDGIIMERNEYDYFSKVEMKNELYSVYKNIYENIFNSHKICLEFQKDTLTYGILKKLNEKYESDDKLKSVFIPISDEKKREELFKHWVLQIVTIAYIASEYECWIEYIPAPVAIIEKDGKEEKRVLGSFIIGYGKSQTQRNERFLFKFISERISLAVGGNHFKKLYNETKKYAVRSAISQLYARTDAHDLGHVYNAYKDIEHFKFDETKGQYKYHKGEWIKKKEVSEKEVLQKDLLAHFNRFIESRMVFRADVATSDPNSLTTLDFYNDIFLPFNNNLIFNNRITGISDENLKYQFKIKNNNKEDSNVNIPIAIPNDVLGCQAMYIIWSNIIRNEVKHGDLESVFNENTPLTFTIDIKDYAENADYYEVSIYSNNGKCEADITPLVKSRNKGLDGSVLNEENRLRDNSLGSIEMDTCTAYLRNLPVTEVENEKYNLFNEEGNFIGDKPYYKDKIPKLLYAYSQSIDNDKFSLGYKFFLLKPKDFLVVQEDEELENSDFLLGKGVDFIKALDLNDNNIYPHKFLVYVGSEEGLENLLSNKNRAILPKRYVLFTKEEIKNINKEECWKRWNIKFIDKVIIKHKANNIDIIINKKKAERIKDIELYDHDDGLNLEKENIYQEMIVNNHWAKSNITSKFRKKNLQENINSFLSYIESTCTKILVIDERIQRNIKQKPDYGGRVNFYNYLEKIDVYIPPIEINLNNTNLLDIKKEIVTYIKDNIAKVHFIILHLGIIEKLLGDKAKVKNSEDIERIIKDMVGKENTHKVIITSGRGKPNNVPNTYSFIPISPLQNAIETLFDKYRLVQLLYNSRKSL